MKEIFVIYDKNTGFIDGGAGRIDRELDDTRADSSTTSERIPKILAKNLNREVVYLPNQTLPDPTQHKIETGKIVLKTEQDKLPTELEVAEKNRVNEIEAERATSGLRKITIDQAYDKIDQIFLGATTIALLRSACIRAFKILVVFIIK